MDVPISNSDIERYIPEATVVVYDELNKIDAEDLLRNLPCFILYETSKDYGHWTMLHNTKDGIEFFDSYGHKPDDEFSFISSKFRKQSGQSFPTLVRLLTDIVKKHKVSFNEYCFQGNDSSTCGKWCLMRAVSADTKNLEQFYDFVVTHCLDQGLTPDELVLKLVNP